MYAGGTKMADQLSEPIPKDVRKAFLEAVQLFDDWKVLGGPTRSVNFRRLKVSLSGVCDLVQSYRNEQLPENVYDEVWNLLDDRRMDLIVELFKDPSYATGARCLEKLIQDHQAEDRRRQEWAA
jgi:hypothetical protein